MIKCLISAAVEVPSDFPFYYKCLSKLLYQAMEDIGASTEMKNLRMEMSTIIELLMTVSYILQISVYIFGSGYEGTSTSGMKSDADIVFVSKDLPVVTDNSAALSGESLLLVQDTYTPPGYAKLQLMRNGFPLLKSACDVSLDIVNSFLRKIAPKSLFAIGSDNAERAVLFLSPTEDVLNDMDRNGPALTGTHVPRGVLTDSVLAFECSEWPQCAAEWLERKRRHNWPSPALIQTCKNLGCILAPVGHSYTKEQHLQWRISLSQQERLLVSQFNSVQHKCYILLKLVKNEILHHFIKQKSLTSYHCKTCMFYMIENTPPQFWRPENFMICFVTCLKTIMFWVESHTCPNYFIPAENMFERKIHGKLRRILSRVLKNLLEVDCKYLLQLQCDDLKGRFEFGFIHKFSSNPRYLAFRYNQIVRYDIKELKLQQISDCIVTLLRCRNRNLMVNTFSPDKTTTKTLFEAISELKHTRTITSHTERETQRGLRLILPYLEISLLSVLIAEWEKNNMNKRDVWTILLSDKWRTVSGQSDSFTSKLKQASLMQMFGSYHASIAVLSSIQKSVTFSICYCDNSQPLKPSQEDLMMNRMLDENITLEDFLHEVVTPCVIYLPAEGSVTPIAICYEMIKSVGTWDLKKYEEETDTYYPTDCDWAIVDGQFLHDFLSFLNHSQLSMDLQVEADIANMERTLKTRRVSHLDTCLNLLGWVYKKYGRRDLAVKYFQTSLAVKPTQNAAVWHFCFLAYDTYSQKI